MIHVHVDKRLFLTSLPTLCPTPYEQFMWSDKIILSNHSIFTMHSCMDDDQLHYRIRLDRRRFEEAHLKYEMLMVQARYPTMATGPLPIATDISDTLEKFTPAFYEAFSHRYSGKLINQT